MNVTGIIAEYNPFHNGHAFHIEETKKNTDADYCIAVISGSFVQRGAPALVNKYDRTKLLPLPVRKRLLREVSACWIASA